MFLAKFSCASSFHVRLVTFVQRGPRLMAELHAENKETPLGSGTLLFELVEEASPLASVLVLLSPAVHLLQQQCDENGASE